MKNKIRCFALALIVSLTLCGHPAIAEEVPSSLWEELQVLDYRGSSYKFKNQMEAAPLGTREWAEATLGYAVCMHQRQPDVRSDKEEAGALYDSLASNSSLEEDIRVMALLFHGRLLQLVDYFKDDVDVDGAIEKYSTLLELAPDSLWGDLAALYKAQCEIFTMEPDRAIRGIEFLTGWIESRGEANSIAALQWLLIGQAQASPLNLTAEAFESYEKVLAIGLGINRKLDDVYWTMANYAQEANLPQEAIEYYSKIIIEEPRSVFGFAAQERIRKLGGTPPPLSDPFALEEGE